MGITSTSLKVSLPARCFFSHCARGYRLSHAARLLPSRPSLTDPDGHLLCLHFLFTEFSESQHLINWTLASFLRCDQPCLICNAVDDDPQIMCDTCGATEHLACFEPPLEHVPDEDWFCGSCTEQQKGTSAADGVATSSTGEHEHDHGKDLVCLGTRARPVMDNHAGNLCSVDGCGQEFDSTSNLLLHMLSDHHLAVHCHICLHYFKTPAALEKHLLSHTDVKPFRCGPRSLAYSLTHSTHSLARSLARSLTHPPTNSPAPPTNSLTHSRSRSHRRQTLQVRRVRRRLQKGDPAGHAHSEGQVHA